MEKREFVGLSKRKRETFDIEIRKKQNNNIFFANRKKMVELSKTKDSDKSAKPLGQLCQILVGHINQGNAERVHSLLQEIHNIIGRDKEPSKIPIEEILCTDLITIIFNTLPCLDYLGFVLINKEVIK